MYEIRHAAAKGLGVFATKSIPRGTRILAERPRFTVTSERDLYPALKSLPAEDRNELMQLSVSANKRSPILDWLEASWHAANGGLSTSSKKDATGASSTRLPIAEYKALLAAFRNNHFDIGNGTQAIFNQICRLNHACIPNAQGNFNTAIGRFTIHATRPIESEDEITISYLDEHGAVRDARQAKLHKAYGFICNCPACNLETSRGKEGERRRKASREKLAKFAAEATNRKEPDLEYEVEMLRMLIKMFEGEGIAGRELSTLYMAAAEGSAKIRDPESAQRYAKLAVEMEEVCLGTDNPMYKETLQRMRKVTTT